jgi:hypothetical protein
MGVKLYGADFHTEKAAKLAGEKELRILLQEFRKVG